VFLGGGRAESTLYLYGTPAAFPESLASRLTTAIEHRLITRELAAAG
jgi:hypothetical protein